MTRPSTPLSSRQRLALAFLWLGLLLVAGWAIGQKLELSGDLRKFMPAQAENQSAAIPHAARAADTSKTTAAPIHL